MFGVAGDSSNVSPSTSNQVLELLHSLAKMEFPILVWSQPLVWAIYFTAIVNAFINSLCGFRHLRAIYCIYFSQEMVNS